MTDWPTSWLSRPGLRRGAGVSAGGWVVSRAIPEPGILPVTADADPPAAQARRLAPPPSERSAWAAASGSWTPLPKGARRRGGRRLEGRLLGADPRGRRGPREAPPDRPWQAVGGQGYEDALLRRRARDGQAEMDALHDAVLERFAKERRKGDRRGAPATPRSRLRRASPTASSTSSTSTATTRTSSCRPTSRRTRRSCGRAASSPGDDYGVEGWWEDGVTRAVDEFVAAGGPRSSRSTRASSCCGSRSSRAPRRGGAPPSSR